MKYQLKYNILKKNSKQYWDTAGNDKYNSIDRAFLKRANGIIIVYDPLLEDDYIKNDLKFWKNEIITNSNINLDKHLWLVGVNKTQTNPRGNLQIIIKEVFPEVNSEHIKYIRSKQFDDIKVYNYIKIRNYLMILRVT